MRSRVHGLLADEQGATMVFVAATMILLIGVAALAVDLSGLRLDRAIDQRVTDAAATAGAITTFESNGRDGCVTALGYLALNAPEIASDAFASETCSSIPTSCAPSDPASSQTFPNGRFDITVVHPVPNAHPLMTSGAIGAPTQATVVADGDQCARIGVQISADRDTTFGQALGSDQNTTTVHSVAIAYKGQNATSPVNLLILDRTACHTMWAAGGGSSPGGGIIVGAVKDGANLLPGWGAADSDGTGCGAGEGVIFKDGNPTNLRADGPPGCATDDPVTPVGEGCGILQTLAPIAVPGTCTETGCEANGAPAEVPKPIPTTMSERLTRQPIDHEFNCVPEYDWSSNPTLYGDISWATEPLTAPDHNINGCSGGIGHIYNLIDVIGAPGTGAPAGYTPYAGVCDIPSSATPISISDDTWFDCDPLIIRTAMTIDANAVFEGDVIVSGSTGLLEINSTNGTAFLRDGTLEKQGQAGIRFNDTFVYFSKTSTILLQAGSGELTWTAPQSGDFQKLALWSDSPSDHNWAGQAVLNMRGAFFMPWATAFYQGNGEQKQVTAQFVAARLKTGGNGALTLTPQLSDIVPLDPPIVTELIR